MSALPIQKRVNAYWGWLARIVAEPDIHRLCELILEEAQNITGAEGGTLYLTSQDQDGMDHQLRFVIVKNTALDLNTEANLPPVELFQPDQAATPNLNSIAAATYHKGTGVTH